MASPGPEPDVVAGRGAAFHCHARRTGLDRAALWQLSAVSALCVLFMIGEIIGGTVANSLALITDATHLASDLMGFLASLFAIWVASKPPTVRMSFGYYRAEVLGALLSVFIIWVTTGVLVFLAVRRVVHDDFHIEADTMLATAGAGVAFNVVMGLVLNMSKRCDAIAHAHGGQGHSHLGGQGHSHGHYQGHTPLSSHQEQSHQPGSACPQGHTNTHSADINDVRLDDVSSDSDVASFEDMHTTQPKRSVNINVRAAFIHVIGDLIQSVGVFIAALVIKFKPDFKLADPICTFIFSVLVLITTLTILKDALMIILEAVPRGLDYRMCKFDLETLEDVKHVHSLNVWALTSGTTIVSVHLAVGPGADRRSLLEKAVRTLREKYGAAHTTVQIEEYDEEMMTACEHCVQPRLC